MTILDVATTDMASSTSTLVAMRAAIAKRARIVMVSPEHFCVRYAINPWMNAEATVNADRARAQWERLRDLVAENAEVLILSGEADLPDMCFSANAGLASRGTFVTSNFRHAERQPEAKLFEAWMQRQGFAIRNLPPSIIFEGAGDALFDSEDRLWMGYGQRSDLSAASSLSALLDTEVIPLALKDERFYHLDTCFCPLQSGHVVFYPDAFTAQGIAALERFIPSRFRIAVSRDDAFNFACNMVDLGDKVVAHRVSVALRAELKLAGYDVRAIDLGEFMKSGGGAKCLTLAIG